jgi:hypothetical protein
LEARGTVAYALGSARKQHQPAQCADPDENPVDPGVYRAVCHPDAEPILSRRCGVPRRSADGSPGRVFGQAVRTSDEVGIADKLLVLSALIVLVQVDRVSALIAILIIAREVAVTGIRAIAATEGIIISAETTGKYKMALQVIAIVLLILEGTVLSEYGNVHLAGIVTLYLSVVLGYLSGGQYVWSFWRQISLKGL